MLIRRCKIHIIARGNKVGNGKSNLCNCQNAAKVTYTKQKAKQEYNHLISALLIDAPWASFLKSINAKFSSL